MSVEGNRDGISWILLSKIPSRISLGIRKALLGCSGLPHSIPGRQHPLLLERDQRHLRASESKWTGTEVCGQGVVS